jgi:hypothetical protein
MKKWIFTLPLALLMVTFSSCLGSDVDDAAVNVSVGTVETGGSYPVFETDDGIKLVCETAMPADTFVAGERYFIYFAFGDTTDHAASTYAVDVQYYAPAALKDFAVWEEGTSDSWDSYPLYALRWLWISGNYMNTIFCNYVPLTTPNTYELIRVMGNEDNSADDTNPTIYFELRHNIELASSVAYDVQFYSFDLSPLVEDFPQATAFNINVSWTTSDETSSTDLVYTPYTPK